MKAASWEGRQVKAFKPMVFSMVQVKGILYEMVDSFWNKSVITEISRQWV